jgi:hypothetical protein
MKDKYKVYYSTPYWYVIEEETGKEIYKGSEQLAHNICGEMNKDD